MSRVGVVTGLQAEAARLAPAAGAFGESGPLVLCLGPGPRRARQAARTLVTRGARWLLSFGLAGGLDPRLVPGTLVVGSIVIDALGRQWPADAAWGARVERAGEVLGLVVGPIAGRDRALWSPAEKTACHLRTGALAVDMESHAVAAVAAEAGIPFLVLRAIADPARRTVPAAARSAIAADGRTQVASVVAALAAKPWQTPNLARLAGDGQRAFRALGRAAHLRPLLLADLGEGLLDVP
ncbi:MAG: purine phosphorylase [Alphaproteobacteria bacterium]